MSSKNLEKIAERYLKKTFNETYRPSNGINDFLVKIRECLDVDYLHADPMSIQWGVTSNCNLRCKHCYYAETKDKFTSKNDLSTEQALDLIDFFDELNAFHIILTGGEPFLRKDIFKIIKKLKSKNMILYVHTNGTLIDKKTAQKLSELLTPQMDIVQVSLDGYSDNVHDSTRGKDSYNYTIDGIKNLIEAGIKTYCNCTITSLNLSEVPKLYRLSQELGVENFSVSKFRNCCESQKYLVPDFGKLLELMNQLLDIEKGTTNLEFAATQVFDFINHNLGTKFLQKFYDKDKVTLSDFNMSCHKHDRLFVAGNGNVYLCGAAEKDEFSLGNVKKQSLTDIWDSRWNNIFFQKRPYKDFPCRKCQYFLVCKGGCAADAYEKYNTLNAPDKNCTLGKKMISLTT